MYSYPKQLKMNRTFHWAIEIQDVYLNLESVFKIYKSSSKLGNVFYI